MFKLVPTCRVAGYIEVLQQLNGLLCTQAAHSWKGTAMWGC